MVARNDVTGDKIQTKSNPSQEYLNNFDLIFGGKNKKKDVPLEHKEIEKEVDIKTSIGDK